MASLISRELNCTPPQRLQGLHQPREQDRQTLGWGGGWGGHGVLLV
jgi:hypothetical protein